jgi:hypothetical protein
MKKEKLTDYEKLWNRIKSKDFKTFILNTYGNINHDNLIRLIEIYKDNFNLRIKLNNN